jgi:hypothetical protein
MVLGEDQVGLSGLAEEDAYVVNPPALVCDIQRDFEILTESGRLVPLNDRLCKVPLPNQHDDGQQSQ